MCGCRDLGGEEKNISLKLDKCFVLKSHSGKIEGKTLNCETFFSSHKDFPKFSMKLSGTSLENHSMMIVTIHQKNRFTTRTDYSLCKKL